MVECLDETRARDEFADQAARVATLQIDRLDAIGGERIVGILGIGGVRIDPFDGVGAVNDDAAVPLGELAKDFPQVDPAEGDEDDVRPSGFLRGAGLDRRTEFSDQFREGFWAASIRDDGRYTRLCKCPRQVRSERACADDADAHGFLLSVSLS